MTKTHDNQPRTGAPEDRIAPRTYWVVGNRLTVLANHAATDGRYDLIEGHQPPGHQTPPHRHSTYSEQFFVLEGEITIWAGKRIVELRAGESFIIPAGTAHAVVANGNRPAHSLVIASPSGFAHLIEQTGTPVTSDTPPELTPADLERFQQFAAEIGDEILGPPGSLPEQ